MLQKKFDIIKGNLKVYENLSLELQDNLNEIEQNKIKTSKNGKYSDDIRTVY